MNLRSLTLAFALALLPAGASAQTAQDAIVSQLSQQGFRNITISRTFLGRVRILAVSEDLRREIVFNPATGEILRDFWQELDDDDSNDRPRATIVNPGGTSGSANQGSQDDENDRDDTEDDRAEDRDENRAEDREDDTDSQEDERDDERDAREDERDAREDERDDERDAREDERDDE